LSRINDKLPCDRKEDLPMGFGKTIVSRSWIKDRTPSYADAAKNQEAMNATVFDATVFDLLHRSRKQIECQCQHTVVDATMVDPGSKSNVNQSKVT
jgi:hypothetical protein